VIASKNENSGFIEKTSRSLTASLVEFKAWSVCVVPLVVVNVVVLAAAKLDFVVRIVATEGVYEAFVIHCREKCLFQGHGSSHSKLSVLVLQV